VKRIIRRFGDIVLGRMSEAELLPNQLREAKISRAEQARLREYHSAMEQMLNTRVATIERELQRATHQGEVQ
jgi:hypothetical protein